MLMFFNNTLRRYAVLAWRRGCCYLQPHADADASALAAARCRHADATCFDDDADAITLMLLAYADV